MSKLRRNLPIALFLLLFGCLVLTATISGATLDADYFFQKARLFRSEGKYLEAMGLYQTIFDTSSDVDAKARALLMIGDSYAFSLDQNDKALDCFDAIFQMYPSTPAASHALFRKGVVLYKTQNYPAAYQVFSAYLEVYPDGSERQTAAVWAESASNLSVSTTTTGETEPSLSEKLTRYSPWTRIRVMLAEGRDKLVVRATAGLVITEVPAGRRSGRLLQRAVFTARDGDILMNGRRFCRGCCHISPKFGLLTLDGDSYRGDLTILAEGDGLSVVNHVPLEKYLYGVVPREVPAKWPRQALMAQAVAARTYALCMKDRNSNNFYDVAATTDSQVYGGFDAETPRTNTAVDATRGKVMVYGNDLVMAYFHSSSGGYTESPGHVWSAEVPYLQSRPDHYSVGSSDSPWTYFLSYTEAAERLRQYGIKISRVKRLRFQQKNRSGRYQEVIVSSDRGVQRLNSNQFRLAIGSTKLKSTCFEAVTRKDGVLFTGSGYGHGVGLSQWGARQMAWGGHDYRSILKYYYADVNIVSVI